MSRLRRYNRLILYFTFGSFLVYVAMISYHTVQRKNYGFIHSNYRDRLNQMKIIAENNNIINNIRTPKPAPNKVNLTPTPKPAPLQKSRRKNDGSIHSNYRDRLNHMKIIADNNNIINNIGTPTPTPTPNKVNLTPTPKPAPLQKSREVTSLSNNIPLMKFEIYNHSQLPDVTVVSAYFNLGRFQKGAGGFFNTNLYMRWSQVYKYLRNPLVFYTDSAKTAELFRKIRTGQEQTTKIVIVKREDVWPFTNIEQIKTIFKTPGYPKHHPNTVVPAYSCAQHAKYAVVEESINKNYFNTKYYTWLDIGYFRYLVNRKKPFVITKPPNFNESCVTMNLVHKVNMDTSVRNIVYGNHVWIGGGMFFGNKESLLLFVEDYRLAVKRYIDMSLISTDQQALFSMNTNKEKKIVRQRVPIQQYSSKIPGDYWFYLGYACYRELP